MPANSFGGLEQLESLIVAKTSDYTVLVSENGTLFTTRGAGAAVTFTLPLNSTVPIGFHVKFFNVSAYGMIIASNPTDTLVGLNNAAADTVTCTTTSLMIGAAVEVVWDGTGWLVFALSAGPTYTVAG